VDKNGRLKKIKRMFIIYYVPTYNALGVQYAIAIMQMSGRWTRGLRDLTVISQIGFYITRCRARNVSARSIIIIFHDSATVLFAFYRLANAYLYLLYSILFCPPRGYKPQCLKRSLLYITNLPHIRCFLYCTNSPNPVRPIDFFLLPWL